MISPFCGTGYPCSSAICGSSPWWPRTRSPSARKLIRASLTRFIGSFWRATVSMATRGMIRPWTSLSSSSMRACPLRCDRIRESVSCGRVAKKFIGKSPPSTIHRIFIFPAALMEIFRSRFCPVRRFSLSARISPIQNFDLSSSILTSKHNSLIAS